MVLFTMETEIQGKKIMEIQSNSKTRDKIATVSPHIDNHPKCKFIEFSNQKAEEHWWYCSEQSCLLKGTE